MFWSRKDVFRYWKYLIFGVSYLIFRLKRKHWMWRESAHTWKLLKGCWSAEEHIQKWRSPGGLEGRRKCNGMLRLFWTQSYQFSRESCQSWSTCRPNTSQQLVKYCRCISLITPILLLFWTYTTRCQWSMYPIHYSFKGLHLSRTSCMPSCAGPLSRGFSWSESAIRAQSVQGRRSDGGGRGYWIRLIDLKPFYTILKIDSNPHATFAFVYVLL